MLLTSHDDIKLVVAKWQVITRSFDFFYVRNLKYNIFLKAFKHGWKGEFLNGLVYKYVRKFMKICILKNHKSHIF
jgi:hypothetical protein